MVQKVFPCEYVNDAILFLPVGLLLLKDGAKPGELGGWASLSEGFIVV